MKKKWFSSIMAIALTGTMILVGCGGSSSPSGSAAESTASAAAEAASAAEEEAAAESESAAESEAPAEEAASGEEKHLNFGIYWFGDDLDPGNGWNGWTLTRAAVGETLVTVNENLEFVGQLADEWETEDDNVTWRFHIRDGVTFQNGNVCDAEAVVGSIKRSLEVNDRGQTNLKLESVEADGDWVVFKTEAPYGAFLANLTEPLFTIVDTSVDTSDYGNHPICTGPYMVTSFEPDVSFDAVAYPGYWGGKPGLDSITCYNLPDDNSRAMALQSGELDMMQRVTSTDLTLFEGNDEYEVQMATGTRVRFLFMNAAKAPFDDANIRHAFSAAVNYDAIAASVGGGVSGVGSPFPPSATFYTNLNRQAYDPDAAADYLEKAGYTDSDGDGFVDKGGEKLTVTVLVSSSATASGDDKTLAEMVQNQVKACGIDLQISMSENVSDAEAAGDFQLVFGNWQTLSTGDPQWFLDQVFKTGATDNYGGYSNADLDEQIDQLSNTFDVDGRMALAEKASQIIIDEAFGSYLIDVTNINVCHSYVKNMSTFPIDYYFLTPQTTVEK